MPKSDPTQELRQEIAERDLANAAEMRPVLTPTVSLLCKLASIAVHADEGLSSDGHHFDLIALRGLITDPEVQAWVKGMQKAAFTPVKRNA